MEAESVRVLFVNQARHLGKVKRGVDLDVTGVPVLTDKPPPHGSRSECKEYGTAPVIRRNLRAQCHCWPPTRWHMIGFGGAALSG